MEGVGERPEGRGGVAAAHELGAFGRQGGVVGGTGSIRVGDMQGGTLEHEQRPLEYERAVFQRFGMGMKLVGNGHTCSEGLRGWEYFPDTYAHRKTEESA